MTSINNVLLVDDDKSILSLAEMALSQLGGFTVKACSSGEAALAALESFHPDIILLDSNMPGLDGPETLQQIIALETLASIPIVFVTGESRPKEIERLLAFGAKAVITKPFDPMTLHQQVNEIGLSA